MSIVDSISEHFHETLWPEHCQSCVICQELNPINDFEKLCAEGQKLAEWMQEL